MVLSFLIICNVTEKSFIPYHGIFSPARAEQKIHENRYISQKAGLSFLKPCINCDYLRQNALKDIISLEIIVHFLLNILFSPFLIAVTQYLRKE